MVFTLYCIILYFCWYITPNKTLHTNLAEYDDYDGHDGYIGVNHNGHYHEYNPDLYEYQNQMGVVDNHGYDNLILFVIGIMSGIVMICCICAVVIGVSGVSCIIGRYWQKYNQSLRKKRKRVNHNVCIESEVDEIWFITYHYLFYLCPECDLRKYHYFILCELVNFIVLLVYIYFVDWFVWIPFCRSCIMGFVFFFKILFNLFTFKILIFLHFFTLQFVFRFC